MTAGEQAPRARRRRAVASNTVAPAVARYNAEHPAGEGQEPWWLPLSLREAIAAAVLEAVDGEDRVWEARR